METEKKEYDGYAHCDCKDEGELEEIEQIRNDSNGTDFIMQCVECKKKYLITTKSFIEEIKEQEEENYCNNPSCLKQNCKEKH